MQHIIPEKRDETEWFETKEVISRLATYKLSTSVAHCQRMWREVPGTSRALLVVMSSKRRVQNLLSWGEPHATTAEAGVPPGIFFFFFFILRFSWYLSDFNNECTAREA